MPFRTTPNRLTPKKDVLQDILTFETMSNWLAPKHRQFWYLLHKSFGTISNRLVSKFKLHNWNFWNHVKLTGTKTVFSGFSAWTKPLEPCQTDLYQNLALTNFWNQSISKVGDTITIVARKLLRTMKSSPHCLPESRIDTSHLSVQSKQPSN